MNYNYKKLRSIKKVSIPKSLPKYGIWHSIPVAAYLKGYPDSQMVRWMYLNNKIEGIKLPVGPILVNLEDIPLKSLKK